MTRSDRFRLAARRLRIARALSKNVYQQRKQE